MMKAKLTPILLVAALLAGPGYAQETAADKPVAVIPISKYALIVPVTIAGKTYHFLLDTGAGYTIVDNRVAAQLTNPAAASQLPDRMRQVLNDGLSTVNSTLKKDDVKLWQPKPITLGNQTLNSPIPWLGMDLSLFTESIGVQIDGFLGIETFRRLNWQVDNQRRTLTVWSQPPSTQGYRQCVPYADTYGGSPELRIDLKGNSWVPFRVDTGASYALAPADLLKVMYDNGAQIEQIGQSVGASASGVHESNEFLADGLSFNGQPIGKLLIRESAGGLNNLGMGFLSRFDSYVFIPSEMVFCYNAGNLARDDQKPRRYISLSYLNGRVEIARNEPDDIARLGLANGDALLAVNGRSVQPARIEELREEVSDTPAGKLTLVIERDGQPKTVDL